MQQSTAEFFKQEKSRIPPAEHRVTFWAEIQW